MNAHRSFDLTIIATTKDESHCDYLINLLRCTLTLLYIAICRDQESTSTRYFEACNPCRTQRRLYRDAIVDSPNIPYVMFSLDQEANMKRPMIFVSCFTRLTAAVSSLSKPSANLNIKLFTKRNRHEDMLLSQTQVQVNTFVNGTDSEGLSCL